MTTTRRGCSTGCRTPRSTASTCSIPILAEEEALEAALRQSGQSRPLRPRAEAGRNVPLRLRHRQLCELDAAALPRAWRLRLAGGGCRRLAHSPIDGWPGTRYEAKALREGRRPAYLTLRADTSARRNLRAGEVLHASRPLSGGRSCRKRRVDAERAQVAGARLAAGFDGRETATALPNEVEEAADGGKRLASGHGLVLSRIVRALAIGAVQHR